MYLLVVGILSWMVFGIKGSSVLGGPAEVVSADKVVDAHPETLPLAADTALTNAAQTKEICFTGRFADCKRRAAQRLIVQF